jgi:hypothetical protein
MGTNFYYRTRRLRCRRVFGLFEWDVKEKHVGKRSAGWQFCFRAHKDEDGKIEIGITSVIVSVSANDPSIEKALVKEIQKWITRERSHLPFREVGRGGGEKNLTCTLLIGSFNCFDTSGFEAWLADRRVYNGEYVWIDLIVQEVDREDFARWKVVQYE